MPTAVTEPLNDTTTEEGKTSESRSDRMWTALKAHVLRERAKKRQQREAEVEEERLRRERERQDVMTLGETRVQITELESRLAELKEEKHQLFRQLKKVLHEDDNRRKQLVKENDMLTGPAPMLAAHSVYPPLFLSSGPPGQSQSSIPSGSVPAFKTSIQSGKRGRSPSPPQQVSVTYTQQQQQPPSAAYATYKAPQPQYQPQKEDSRRPHEFVRAVLWNKPSQYTNPPATSFYAVPPSDRTPIVYYPAGGIPARNTEPAPPRGPPGLYESYGLPPGARPPPQQAPTHVTVHGGAIPITPAQPVSKTGSITAGYPVRSQSVAQYQQQSGMYTTGGPPQARPLYSTPPGATLTGYPPPRD